MLKKSLTGCLLFWAAIGFAQQPFPPPGGPGDPQFGPPGAQQPQLDDPPGRAGRLSLVRGTVSFQPGGVEDWIPASLNRPMTTGDRLWTEAGARAEIGLGTAAIRLNSRTSFTFLNLNDNLTQVQISTGSLSVRLRRIDEGEGFEIDTPNVAFTLLRAGEYRVDVNEQGDATVLTVRGGDGEASSGGQLYPVRARQQVRVAGGVEGSAPIFDGRDAPVPDNFDNFCMNRDRQEDRSESARHVSRDIPGYADLDEHGVWREDGQLGWIWAPRVEAGWAPYHYGHWAWISPWGWTWVDDAPWGYAPFHYGRWAFSTGAWVWVPGPYAARRPVYSPALVAWVGGPRFGVSLGLGVGVGAAAWFALAPGEVFVPSYRASPAYFNQVNVSNTLVNRNVNITNVYNNTYVNKTVTNTAYVNQNVNGAVAAVPQNVMTSGGSVAGARVPVTSAALQSAQVQQSAQIAPQRAAVIGGAPATSAAPPAAIMSRGAVARQTPPAPPVPFAQQQQALQANPGQPLPNRALTQIRSQGNAAAPAARPAFRQALPNSAPNSPQQASGPIPAQNAPQNSPVNQNAPRVQNNREEFGAAPGARSGSGGPLPIASPQGNTAPQNNPPNPQGNNPAGRNPSFNNAPGNSSQINNPQISPRGNNASGNPSGNQGNNVGNGAPPNNTVNNQEAPRRQVAEPRPQPHNEGQPPPHHQEKRPPPKNEEKRRE